MQTETNVLKGVNILIIRERAVCPMCGDEVDSSELDRYCVCLDCFADSIQSNVGETVLFDFLREYAREFRQYIEDNYWE